MGCLIDITGRRYGRWTVVGRSAMLSKCKQPYWRCRCDCGTEKVVMGMALRHGYTTSCGCLRSETAGRQSVTHGHTRNGRASPEYRVWQAMLARCRRPSSPDYDNYGGRGIRVCDRWEHSFPTFLLDMGSRPTPHHTIDRIDTNGNYEPGNCRWLPKSRQSDNRRVSIRLTHNGQTRTITEWSPIVGIRGGLIRSRIHRGWSAERALTTPAETG